MQVVVVEGEEGAEPCSIFCVICAQTSLKTNAMVVAHVKWRRCKISYFVFVKVLRSDVTCCVHQFYLTWTSPVCPPGDVSVSVWELNEEVDELLLLLFLLEERGLKLWISTSSSSDDDDDDDDELSSDSELRSSSWETQMLVYSHLICLEADVFNVCQNTSFMVNALFSWLWSNLWTVTTDVSSSTFTKQWTLFEQLKYAALALEVKLVETEKIIQAENLYDAWS